MQDLLDQFRITLADGKLSSQERKALLDVLRMRRIDKTQKDFLISGLYEMGLLELGKGNDGEVMNWLRRATALVYDNEDPGVPMAKMAFSPGKECLGLIQEAIMAAKHTLDVCVFTISDDRISDLLIQQHQNGIRVRVLTDNEKLLDEGSDIEKIDRAGISVKVDRTQNHMHHKFAIFDNHGVLTGSYNWTRSAEAYNQENVLLTFRPHIVAEYQACFRDLWNRMKEF